MIAAHRFFFVRQLFAGFIDRLKGDAQRLFERAFERRQRFERHALQLQTRLARIRRQPRRQVARRIERRAAQQTTPQKFQTLLATLIRDFRRIDGKNLPALPAQIERFDGNYICPPPPPANFLLHSSNMNWHKLQIKHKP